MTKKMLIFVITFVSATYGTHLPGGLDLGFDIPGLDKLGELGTEIGKILPMEELQKIASFGEEGLSKLGSYTSEGLDKAVELSHLDEAMGITYDTLNKIKVTEAFESMGIPANVATYIGFPFDVVGSLGKDLVRVMVELPEQVVETTKTLVNLMTNPREAAEYAKRYFELFKQLATMQPAVHLCHGGCGIDILLRNIATSEPLVDGFEDIRDFLKSRPREVVFIFFEDYIKNGPKVDALVEKSGLASLVLKPSDWNPVEKGGWPTFGWARANNKRAILISDDNGTAGTSKYIFWQSTTVMEGNYSSIGDIDKGGTERFKDVCVERSSTSGSFDNIPRYMTMLNLFPEAPIPLEEIKAKDFVKLLSQWRAITDSATLNSKKTLTTYINACAQYGIGPKGKQEKMHRTYPNFIAIDFVDQGDALNVVNDINQKAIDAKKAGTIDKMFEPIVMRK